ncbi:MAG: MBL fold metallo-hydrolase, partial [Rhodobacteraceae bacterium]|nr:MBL fold metallo-hydrolase [Paracoccaceae bacterium]
MSSYPPPRGTFDQVTPSIRRIVAPNPSPMTYHVTHAHYDHSELAMQLSKTVGAPIYAFGDHQAGKSALMKSLSERGGLGGGEGIDRAFEPDHTLSHLESVTCDEWRITAHHTPGHMANHMCLEKILITADHVMDWATSMVSPPDGDVGDFMRSCEHLLHYDWDLFLPGHGDIVRAPNERLRWLLYHRREREVQILTQLQAG